VHILLLQNELSSSAVLRYGHLPTFSSANLALCHPPGLLLLVCIQTQQVHQRKEPDALALLLSLQPLLLLAPLLLPLLLLLLLYSPSHQS
jgi:hypothetical protein